MELNITLKFVTRLRNIATKKPPRNLPGIIISGLPGLRRITMMPIVSSRKWILGGDGWAKHSDCFLHQQLQKGREGSSAGRETNQAAEQWRVDNTEANKVNQTLTRTRESILPTWFYNPEQFRDVDFPKKSQVTLSIEIIPREGWHQDCGGVCDSIRNKSLSP